MSETTQSQNQFAKGISLFQTKSFEPAQKFFVPESESSSYRLRGGTGKLIDALSEKLESGRVVLDARVVAIEESDDKLKVLTAEGQEYYGSRVIICMPPQLASSKVLFSPGLPAPVTEVLGSVQTWMAGSIKFTLEYSEPFWRENGYSGMLYSHAGIITEMYDHTNFEETKFGFTGFLNSGSAAYTQDVRKEFVIRQLVELIGAGAAEPAVYYDKVWKDEFVLDGVQVIQRPHQNNGHPLLQQPWMNGKLFFCGTETSPICGGYMEGAVISAQRTLRNLQAIDADIITQGANNNPEHSLLRC
jgi:monoamine oxidase